MKNQTTNSLLYLVTAGFVLLTVNAWVWMAVQNGQLSPVGNSVLWGAFMVLNMISLLWAVGLLGLQPLVVACSYAIGGFLAYRGVQGVASINVAEVTTAGATYGAIGALAVGNVTTKVRMAFFRKGQVPFIFVIVALLVVDGVLNSQIFGADWNVVLNALVLPFGLAGIVVGLIWMVVSRFGIAHKLHIKEMSAVDETSIASVSEDNDEADGASQLMIQVPDTVEVEDEPEEIAAMLAMPELGLEEHLPAKESRVELSVPVVDEAEKEDSPEEHFFPLEIDKDDEFIAPYEEVVDPVESLSLEVEPEPFLDSEPVLEPERMSEPEIIPEPLPEPISDPEPIPEPIPEPEPILEPVVVSPQTEEDKPESDWLSGHLDLMNKISGDN